MKRLAQFIITILMFLTAPVAAQKKQAPFIEWKIEATLPAENGRQPLGIAGPVTGAHRAVLMIGGGANFPHTMPWQGGEKVFHDKVYLYTRKQGRLTRIKRSIVLPSPIAYAACCNTPNGVLYAGGENANGLSDQVWLMQWDAISRKVNFTSLPSLPEPLSNAAITRVGQLVYIAGGETDSGAISGFLVLDLNDPVAGWKKLPAVPQPVSHATLTAVKSGKKIYLAGGRMKNRNGISALYTDVYIYNIATNSWSATTQLPYPLCAGTSTLYKEAGIILFGGDQGTVFHKIETLLAAISAEKNEGKKQGLIGMKNKVQSEHPGFSREVLLYSFATKTWKVIDTMPFDAPVTTTAIKWGALIIIPSGEIKPGVRSPHLLSAKFLQKAK